MSTRATGTRVLITLAAFVIVVAGLRAAESLIVPFLLASLIAMICTPPLFWLQSRNVPTALAVLIIVFGVIVIGTSLGIFLGTSINDFAKAAPGYQASLTDSMSALFNWLNAKGIEISRDMLDQYFDPSRALKMITASLRQLGGALTNAFLILLTVIFILLEASGFPAKLRSALDNPDESLVHFREITENVKQYLMLKTILSAATGILVYVWLMILGVDFPVLWGLVAFLFNYVPNIGSIIAAIPAVLLAFVQFGFAKALIVAGGYMVVNIAIGSIIEPRVMGRGLGLSTLVVFLSLVFWGWVLGPVGMLLSVLLTMIVKIALESREDTRWLGVLLGNPEPQAARKSE